MTTINRRTVLAAVAAITVAPLPKEAPRIKWVEAFVNGRWVHMPGGLRQLVKGQRFRMYAADIPEGPFEFADVVATDDPIAVLDDKGFTCGGIYWEEYFM